MRVLEILDPCDRDFPAALENVSSQMASFVHGAQERASKSTESSNVTVSEQWARENFGWDEADFLQVLN